MSHIVWPCKNPGPWAWVWVESVGRRNCSAYNMDTKPDYLCLHLVATGKARFQTDNGVNIVLGPDDMFTMWPGIGWWLYAEPPYSGTQVSIDWVRFKGPLAPAFVRMIGTTETRPWGEASKPRQARRLMRRLQSLAKRYPQGADLLSIAILYELAAACTDYQTERYRARPLAERIREEMARHVGSGMNITEYAQAFGISRSTLFLLFKEHFGTTPVEMLTELKLRCAQDLLASTQMSVKEIVRASGYANPAHFCRAFKVKTGMTPKMFRRHISSNEPTKAHPPSAATPP